MEMVRFDLSFKLKVDLDIFEIGRGTFSVGSRHKDVFA
jgi:hypothetical protein